MISGVVSVLVTTEGGEADCAVVEGFADDAAVEAGDFTEAGDVGCGADAAAGDELAAKGVDGVVDAFGFGEVRAL